MELLGGTGGEPPTVDFDPERGVMYGVIDAMDRGLVLSCHDISDGGLVVSLFEMLVDSELGARLDLPMTISGLPWMEALLSESGGFLMEVAEDQVASLSSLFARHEVTPLVLGVFQDDRDITIVAGGERRATLALDELTAAWRRTIPELMS